MPSPSPESAPLLNEHDASTISDDYSTPMKTRLASRLHRYAKIIRVSGLILSIFIIIMIIAILILLKVAPLSTWRGHTDGAVMKWYIASAITAIIVLSTPLPALLSFASDVVFLVGTIVCSVRWIKYMPLSECGGRYDWNSKKWYPPPPKCKDYQLAINIVMGFIAAFGILLATSYALLIVFRVYNVLSKVVRSKLPGSGEITWTVNLNVLTDGHERTYGFSVGAKADSKSTQGLVHL